MTGVPSRQPSIIQRGLEYPVPDLAGAPPGGSGSLADILHGLRQEQVGNAFSQTQLRCGMSPFESAELSECEQAWVDYILSLIVPYGIPLFFISTAVPPMVPLLFRGLLQVL